MKLLVVLPSNQRGGAEEYALTIASASVQKGWQVHAAFPQTEGTVSLIRDFTNNQVNYHPLAIADTGHQGVKAVQEQFLRLIQIFLLLLSVRPTVVLVNLPSPVLCFTGLFACGLLQIPTAVVFHLIPFVPEFNDRKLSAYAWARTRNQQWITVSETNRKLISEIFHCPLEEIKCIYNGTNATATTIHHQADRVTVRSQIRQELGISENSQILLTVARLAFQKGHRCLIPVISQIVQEFPTVKFVWAGTGEQQEWLMSQVREQGVEDSVLFLGHRTDVPRLLDAADLFVFPTYFEGFPFALLEAMAHRLPIVASEADSVSELVENKVYGLLFQTGDSEALLESLRWALQHPEQMQAMAENAKRRVQDFSEETMITKTLDSLKTLSCTFS